MPNGTSGGVGGSEVQTRSLPDRYGAIHPCIGSVALMGLDLLHNCEADNRWNDWGFSDYLALDRMLLDSHHVTKGHYWPKECASRQKRRAAARKAFAWAG